MTDTMLVSPTGNDLGGSWWILLLFFLLMGGNGFGGNAFTETQAASMNGFNTINSGVQNLATQIGGGFANAETAANGRQIADMQGLFGLQTAMTNGFFGLQSQLSQCCCDNRLATFQTQSVVQTEAAATRLAIEQQTNAILDKMCQQEIDNLKAQNLALQNQVNMLNLSASQTAQTAQLEQFIASRVTPSA